jgi:hypothetical protein
MRIFVKVKSRAKKQTVEKVDDSHFIVSTFAIPQKGEANEAVIRLLAGHFDVAPSRVCLVSGMSAKQKVFEIN